MNRSKAAVIIHQFRQKIESFSGWTLAILMGLMIIVSLTDRLSDDVGVYVMMIFLLAAGVWLILKGKKRKKLISDFRNYVQILAGNPSCPLDVIARKSSTPLETVKSNVRWMIRKGFFVDAVIDEETDRLILNGETATRPEPEAVRSMPQKPVQAEIEMFVVKCSGCGSVHQVPKGRVIPCEYCGNMLKGE